MYIKNKHLRSKRGQSTVEYILLVTAVIAVIIVFTTSSGNNSLKGELNATLNVFTTAIGTESNAFDTSHSSLPAFNGAAAAQAPYTVKVTP